MNKTSPIRRSVKYVAWALTTFVFPTIAIYFAWPSKAPKLEVHVHSTIPEFLRLNFWNLPIKTYWIDQNNLDLAPKEVSLVQVTIVSLRNTGSSPFKWTKVVDDKIKISINGSKGEILSVKRAPWHDGEFNRTTRLETHKLNGYFTVTTDFLNANESLDFLVIHTFDKLDVNASGRIEGQHNIKVVRETSNNTQLQGIVGIQYFTLYAYCAGLFSVVCARYYFVMKKSFIKSLLPSIHVVSMPFSIMLTLTPRITSILSACNALNIYLAGIVFLGLLIGVQILWLRVFCDVRELRALFALTKTEFNELFAGRSLVVGFFSLEDDNYDKLSKFRKLFISDRKFVYKKSILNKSDSEQEKPAAGGTGGLSTGENAHE
ncbi:MAG: hypothetical protein GC164_13890 [Phycisphaera sp.]|nr:hypothetical protein [Phycisphaera sp.]